MQGAIFRKCHIVQCNFNLSDLSDADFTKAQLKLTKLTELQKQHGKFSGAVIDGIKQPKGEETTYDRTTDSLAIHRRWKCPMDSDSQRNRKHTRWV